MEKIIVNTETIISSLFLLGFDKVDSVLFTLIQGNIKSILSKKYYDIEFNNTFYNCELIFASDKPFSHVFEKCIDDNGVYFSLSEKYSLDTDVSKYLGLEDYMYTLREYLGRNNNARLLSILINDYIDMSEIVKIKLNQVGRENIELFSKKELEIISNLTSYQKKKLYSN